MCGYSIWIGERWGEWRASRGMPGTGRIPATEQEHEEFTGWLGSMSEKTIYGTKGGRV